MANVSAVITGIGPVSAIGVGKDELWQVLINGQPGFGPITICDTSRSPSKVAAELELLVNISASVDHVPDSFQRFVRDAPEKNAIEAGTIDEKRARWIRRVIFGSGSSSGRLVDQTEKMWLQKIDESVKGKTNHVSWEILKHVLEIA